MGVGLFSSSTVTSEIGCEGTSVTCSEADSLPQFGLSTDTRRPRAPNDRTRPFAHKESAQLATFASGKHHNADLNGAYNIAARGLALLLGVPPKTQA